MLEYLKTLPSLQHSAAGDGFREDSMSKEASREDCLSDDEILAFVQGDLSATALEGVHSHLDRCGVCQRLLATAAHAISVEPLPDSRELAWNAVFQPHTMIGNRYRIVRLVARGGMGEIYEAYDTILHDRVALKAVASVFCDSVHAIQLLKAEVQLAR